MFILILALFFTPIQAQDTKPGGLEKGIRQFFLSSPAEECEKNLPGCKNFYELTLNKESTTTANHFKSMAIFGTVFEFAEACHEGDKLTCDLVSSIFNDTKDDCQKFSPENNLLCHDVKNFRLKACAKIKDSLLESVCSKKPSSECRSDMICLLTWSYAFRESAENLKLSSPTIIKEFMQDYTDSKINVAGSTDIIYLGEPIKPDLLKAPLFPAPQKIRDFYLSTPKAKTIAQKTKPSFKPLTVVNNVFPHNVRQFLHPWNKGSGMTVVDWDGDGFLDVFAVDGENLLLFENVNGKEFKKFSINFPVSGHKGMLTDISVADIDDNGFPVIIVQSFPRTVYVLRWVGTQNAFLTETINLPNFSRTHAFVKFKSGLGIVFPGWSGIGSAPNPMASDYVARIDKKGWNFEILPNSEAPTLGVSVIERAPGVSTLVLNRDMEGGTDFHDISGDFLVKLPDSGKMNYFSHSTAFLKTTKNEDLWVTTGLGFDNGKDTKKRKFQEIPRGIEECAKNWSGEEKQLCVIKNTLGYTRLWPSLCTLHKNPEVAKICLTQNEVPGISGVKMPNPFKYSTQFYRNLKAPIIDEPANKLGAEMGQVWHVAPLQSPSMEGFLMSEARVSKSKIRKLWWMGVTKTGIQKTELTNSLGLSDPYDATQFALGDFDKDGQLDMVFKSGTDLVILKGDTGGDSSLTNNLQMGFQSRTLIKIPVNNKE